jgi:hypothetical protein
MKPDDAALDWSYQHQKVRPATLETGVDASSAQTHQTRGKYRVTQMETATQSNG